MIYLPKRCAVTVFALRILIPLFAAGRYIGPGLGVCSFATKRMRCTELQTMAHCSYEFDSLPISA
jgi:hypothetical protein